MLLECTLTERRNNELIALFEETVPAGGSGARRSGGHRGCQHFLADR